MGMPDATVSVLGLGDMGSALAESLIDKGYGVTVWNRSPARAEPLAARGAKVAPDAAAAIATSSVSVICVAGHAATMGMLASAADAVRGHTLIQLSTMTSAQAREFGDWVDTCGGAYLDGQVLNYPDDVREGRCIVALSGPGALVEAHSPMLADMAGHVHHAGEARGAAAALDKAYLSFEIGLHLAMMHGAAMCARASVDIETYLDHALDHLGNGKAAEEAGIVARQIRERAYTEGLDATIATWHGALDAVVGECDALGVTPLHVGPIHAAMGAAIAAGRGGEEIGALFEVLAREN